MSSYYMPKLDDSAARTIPEGQRETETCFFMLKNKQNVEWVYIYFNYFFF